MTRSLEATPSDLWCWIWAAVPPTKRRWLNVPRAALRLGVSEATIRRWLKVGDIPSPAVARRLMQLAILRGRGHLLWPTPDTATIEREQRQSVYASRAARAGLDVAEGPCDLVITRHPRAHAYTISVLSDGKSLDRIIRAGGVVEYQQTYPSLWAAQTAKFGVLEAVTGHRCILPKALAPRSHTLAWREAGGVPTPPEDT